MRKANRDDSLTVREWIGLFTEREPPMPAELLDRPVNRVPKRELAPISRWMETVGVTGEICSSGSRRTR